MLQAAVDIWKIWLENRADVLTGKVAVQGGAIKKRKKMDMDLSDDDDNGGDGDDDQDETYAEGGLSPLT